MAQTLELKDLPDEIAAQIRRRAELHQRTPEEEAVRLLVAALTPRGKISTRQLLERVRAAGIATPEEAARMLREDRDGR